MITNSKAGNLTIPLSLAVSPPADAKRVPDLAFLLFEYKQKKGFHFTQIYPSVFPYASMPQGPRIPLTHWGYGKSGGPIENADGQWIGYGTSLNDSKLRFMNNVTEHLRAGGSQSRHGRR